MGWRHDSRGDIASCLDMVEGVGLKARNWTILSVLIAALDLGLEVVNIVCGLSGLRD